MNKNVLRRWLYFVVAGIATAVVIIIAGLHPEAFPILLATLSPGVFFTIALIQIRKLASDANPIAYGCLTTALFAIPGSIVFGIYLNVSWDSVLISSLPMAVIGMFVSMFIGTGYGKFMGRDHPPVLSLVLFGAGGMGIPFLALKVLEWTLGTSFEFYGFAAIAMCWVLIMGFSFSLDTPEDLPDSFGYFSKQIKKIGKKNAD